MFELSPCDSSTGYCQTCSSLFDTTDLIFFADFFVTPFLFFPADLGFLASARAVRLGPLSFLLLNHFKNFSKHPILTATATMCAHILADLNARHCSSHTYPHLVAFTKCGLSLLSLLTIHDEVFPGHSTMASSLLDNVCAFLNMFTAKWLGRDSTLRGQLVLLSDDFDDSHSGSNRAAFMNLSMCFVLWSLVMVNHFTDCTPYFV